MDFTRDLGIDGHREIPHHKRELFGVRFQNHNPQREYVQNWQQERTNNPIPRLRKSKHRYRTSQNRPKGSRATRNRARRRKAKLLAEAEIAPTPETFVSRLSNRGSQQEMRGGSGGRGRVRRNRGNGHAHQHASGQMRLLNNGKLPFDLTFFEDIFPPVTPAQDDNLLNAALLKRNIELSPSTEEIQTTQNLVTRVQSILETLILTPGTFEACQVDEVRQVGSFKQGTILAGHKTADFVVILKTLPTREAIEALSNKVTEELRQTECVRSTVTNRGFDLSNVQATIRVFITTVPQNFRKLDPEIHLESKLMTEHWQAIRHSRWFEENAHNSTIKVLIRILRDLRQRYSEFLPLSTWMLDLLAHFCVMNNPARQALPINVAFRRTLSLMSCGMYLPGYAGTAMRGHNLSYEEQDMATGLAQTLLRIMAQGGYKVILGLETNPAADLVNIPTVWDDGVVVSPLEKVYEKPADGEVEKIEEDENPEEEEEEDTPMEPETA